MSISSFILEIWAPWVYHPCDPNKVLEVFGLLGYHLFVTKQYSLVLPVFFSEESIFPCYICRIFFKCVAWKFACFCYKYDTSCLIQLLNIPILQVIFYPKYKMSHPSLYVTVVKIVFHGWHLTQIHCRLFQTIQHSFWHSGMDAWHCQPKCRTKGNNHDSEIFLIKLH